ALSRARGAPRPRADGCIGLPRRSLRLSPPPRDAPAEAGRRVPRRSPPLMHRVAVDDPKDPRLSPFLDLRDTRMRAAREPAEGFFLAEGVRTIRRALAAGNEPPRELATRTERGQRDH